MGDMADYLNEQGEDMWIDHINGHEAFPRYYQYHSDDCPYCQEEERKADELQPRNNGR